MDFPGHRVPIAFLLFGFCASQLVGSGAFRGVFVEVVIQHPTLKPHPFARYFIANLLEHLGVVAIV